MNKRDYYEVLEVHLKASQEVIGKAYHLLAQKYHPDMHSPHRKKWAEAKFKELVEAYEVLSNPQRRKDYDQSRTGLLSARGNRFIREDSKKREKAYFYYRTGLEYYKKVIEKRNFWYGYTGRWQSDLAEAQKNFVEVINKHSDTVFVEDAKYYYFCILTKKCDYTKEYQAKVEAEFESFSSSYPNGKWLGDALIELASFYLFKGFKFNKAVKVLEEFLKEYPHHKLAEAASGLLECAEAEGKKSQKAP